MRASPVQLIQSAVDSVLVKPSDSVDAKPAITPFDLGKMSISVHKVFEKVDFFSENPDCARPNVEGVDDRTYFIQLGIRTNDGDNNEHVPYRFEIVCSGVIAVLADRVNDMPAELAAKRLGLSMLYSQIRELVSSLTARMTHGPMTIPTMSFADEVLNEESTHPATLAKECGG